MLDKMWCTLLCVVLLVGTSSQRTLHLRNEANTHSNIEFNNFGEEDGVDNCYCDRRFLKHYEARECKVVLSDGCGCPIKFQCPNATEINDQVCHYNGRDYNSGQVIPTFDPCQQCQCSTTAPVQMECQVVQCQEMPELQTPNCHHIYHYNQCCPIGVRCLADTNDEENDRVSQPVNKTCTTRNKQIYPLGAKMLYEDDPCEVCFCTESWLRGDRSECYSIKCIVDKAKMDNGCVPIYEEGSCCPVDFYCGNGNELAVDNSSRSWTTFESSEVQEEDLRCTFSGKQYGLSDVAYFALDSDCLMCVCITPSDLTCLRKNCPSNPDVENCHPQPDPIVPCCPLYECLQKDEATPRNSTGERELEKEVYLDPKDGCLETSCDKEMICMLFGVTCETEYCPPVATCTFLNSSCPTPMCETGCIVSEQDEFRCPTCVCEEEQKFAELRCPMPSCSGSGWSLVVGEDGCPNCQTVDPCPQLECPENCNVQTVTEGQCPKCVCEDDTEGCPTPVCENESCRIENSSHGCPTCICDEAIGTREVEDIVDTSSPSYDQQQQQQQSSDKEESADSELVQRSYDGDYDGEIIALSDSAFKINNRPLFRGRNKLLIDDNEGPSNSITGRQPIRQSHLKSIVQQRTNYEREDP